MTVTGLLGWMVKWLSGTADDDGSMGQLMPASVYLVRYVPLTGIGARRIRRGGFMQLRWFHIRAHFRMDNLWLSTFYM